MQKILLFIINIRENKYIVNKTRYKHVFNLEDLPSKMMFPFPHRIVSENTMFNKIYLISSNNYNRQ